MEIRIPACAAVLIPRAPLALSLKGACLQQIGPFIAVMHNRNCAIVPACAGASILVGRHAGVICACPGGWALSLPAARVCVPMAGSVTVTPPDGSSIVVHQDSDAVNYGRWCVCRSKALPAMAPVLTNLLSVLQAAPDGNPAERAQLVHRCFPNACNAVAAALLSSLAPGATTPAAAALTAAQTFGTARLLQRYTRLGGFARRDDGTCYALQQMARSKTGAIAVSTCPQLPGTLVYREATDAICYRHQTTTGPLGLHSTADTAAACIANAKLHKFVKPLPIAAEVRAYTPMEVLFGVPAHHVGAAMTLFTRKGEKEPYKYSLVANTSRQDAALAKELLLLQPSATAQIVQSTMLGMARGHALAKALHLSQSQQFVPGTRFRAPSCKKLLGKKSIWATHVKRRASATRGARLQEPYALLGKGTMAAHNDADLRAWQAGKAPLVPFRLVWQPKLDGWRILLHNSTAGVLWASNTGRDITELVPEKLRRAVAAAINGVPPFVLEGELVAGPVDDISPPLMAAMGAAAVPRRTRASAVRSRGLGHTLFITDALVIDNVDISNQSQRSRRTATWKLRDQMGPCPVRVVPQFALNTRSPGVIPVKFVARAFKAMVQADMEGVVVKAESLVYGSTHTVIKPINYGTLGAFPRPLAPAQFKKLFPHLLAVVYMGFIDMPQAPWAAPVFGVASPGTFPKRHPWHGYAPVHIEGYKVAYAMLRAANAAGLPHVRNHEAGMHTGWTLSGAATSTGCVQHLHPVTSASPLLWLAAERVYRRVDMIGWQLPLRLYLPRVWKAQRPTRPSTADEALAMLAAAEHRNTQTWPA